MPRPTPSYIPQRLIDQANGLRPKEYAMLLGLHSHRFYSLFGGTHGSLLPYCKLADFACVTLDELAEIIRSKKMSDWLRTLRDLDGKPYANLHQIAKAALVTDDWLRYQAKSDGELKGLKDYYEVAQKLGWTLDEMRACCGLVKAAA